MKVGIIQSAVGKNREDNILRAVDGIKSVSQRGADIAVLGEMFICPYSNKSFIINAEPGGDFTLPRLSAAAKQYGIYVVGGSIPLLEDGKLYNASFVFDREGQVIACHKKMHLFDVDIEGGQKFKESDTFAPGDSVTVFDTEFGKMGLCVCFDFRFPELARLMALEGASCIFVPAAFNMTTGPAHWEVMFRGRAVDNQYFTVGVAPARSYEGYVSYANSIVVSPWGEVVFRAGESPCEEVVDVDLSRVGAIRGQLPLHNARRTDVYSLKRLK